MSLGAWTNIFCLLCFLGASNTECNQFVKSLINSSLVFLQGTTGGIVNTSLSFHIEVKCWIFKMHVCLPVFLSVGVTLSGLRCCFVFWTFQLKVLHRMNMWADSVSGVCKSQNSNGFYIVLTTWYVGLLMAFLCYMWKKHSNEL